MALEKCRGCGNEVSTKAKSCPNCGTKAPFRISGFIIGIVIIGFALPVGFALFKSPSESKPAAHASAPQANAKTVASKPDEKPAQKSVEKPKPQQSAWTFTGGKDGMSGEVNSYIYTHSLNSLEGWLDDGEVGLGYDCSTGFYVRSTDLGFSTDKVLCSDFECRNAQNARVRFDDGEFYDIKFSIWEDSHDGMSHWDSAKGCIGRPELIQKMKAGNRMFLELELFNSLERQQIAEFDLTGFTSAISKCR